MEQEEFVTVYTLTNPMVAELIRNDLEAEGIRCILAGIEQASNVGLPGTEIQVQVSGEDSARARVLIESHDVIRETPDEEDQGEDLSTGITV